MRISLLSNDPGYDPTHERRVKQVTLNGRPMLGIVTADEEEGFIIALVRDPLTGEWQRNGSEFQTLRETGKVVIELMPKGEREWDPTRKAQGGHVRVQVGIDPSTGDLLVQVFSVVRPGALKQARLPSLRLPAGKTATCQAAGTLAGVVAEALCEQFGDTLDPSAAAAEAVRQCARMLAGRG